MREQRKCEQACQILFLSLLFMLSAKPQVNNHHINHKKVVTELIRWVAVGEVSVNFAVLGAYSYTVCTSISKPFCTIMFGLSSDYIHIYPGPLNVLTLLALTDLFKQSWQIQHHCRQRICDQHKWSCLPIAVLTVVWETMMLKTKGRCQKETCVRQYSTQKLPKTEAALFPALYLY